MIYLDNSATTLPNDSVLRSYQHVAKKYYGNPSSIHALGGQAEKLLQTARNQVADILNVQSEEIVFTSGGTEGNNAAIKGIALAHQNRGKHIITSKIEHPSVLEACKSLEQLGFEITYLSANRAGVISVEELKDAIKDDTILISIMHVNNELGSIQPIEAIGKIAKEYPKLYFHVDHVQGLGKIPLSISENHIDLCTLSGHKIHGLKGTGILYVSKSTTLFPLLHGGNQEHGIRSGTENLPGAVAMAKAVRLIKEKEQNNWSHLRDLNQYLRNQLENIEEITVNSSIQAAPHIINISIQRLKPETVIHALSAHNILISTKSACSSKLQDDSAVLTACGFSKERSTTALRISMTYANTKEELQTFIRILKKVIKQLTK